VTWDGWLSVLHPYLAGPLFDERARECLGALTRRLPGECLGALEVRLAPGPAPVDFSLRLTGPEQARLIAPGRLPPHLDDFLARWAKPRGLFAPVRAVWLEFDLDGPVPGPMPGPVADALVPAVIAKLGKGSDPGWLLDVLWPALQGSPLRPSQRERVRSCWEAIPPEGFLLYAFSLLSRPGGAVRMELFGLDPEGIAAYLERIAPAAVERVGEAAGLFQDAERLHLTFDIVDEVLPRIGIEGSYPRLPRREPAWAALLERFVAAGLCAPEKRDALLAWPGYDTFWTAPASWPVGEVGTHGFCVRGLSHLKVVSWPDREPEAKAYLVAGWRA
jgi:hypothetical protein